MAKYTGSDYVYAISINSYHEQYEMCNNYHFTIIIIMIIIIIINIINTVNMKIIDIRCQHQSKHRHRCRYRRRRRRHILFHRRHRRRRLHATNQQSLIV